MTRPAREALSAIADRDLAVRAIALVSLVEEYVAALSNAGRDLGAVPPLRASLLEDQSILLTWATKDFSIGFNVEKDPEESGWHIVFSRRLGEEAAAGFLTPANADAKVAQLLNTVLAST